MQPRFDAVFRVWGCTGFDPQVAGIVRVPAKFKWHEMVILSARQGSAVAVCCCVGALFGCGDGSRRADRLGVAGPADRGIERVWGDLRADRAGGCSSGRAGFPRWRRCGSGMFLAVAAPARCSWWDLVRLVCQPSQRRHHRRAALGRSSRGRSGWTQFSTWRQTRASRRQTEGERPLPFSPSESRSSNALRPRRRCSLDRVINAAVAGARTFGGFAEGVGAIDTLVSGSLRRRRCPCRDRYARATSLTPFVAIPTLIIGGDNWGCRRSDGRCDGRLRVSR